jgi:hypothetical protein
MEIDHPRFQEEAETVTPVEKYEDKEEYAYLKHGFSSECFRIEVRNLPKFFGNIKKKFQY